MQLEETVYTSLISSLSSHGWVSLFTVKKKIDRIFTLGKKESRWQWWNVAAEAAFRWPELALQVGEKGLQGGGRWGTEGRYQGKCCSNKVSMYMDKH